MLEQPEHPLHVGQRLLDLAVDHAEKIERNIELDQEAVDEHEVAERERLRDHALRREYHQQRHRDRNNAALPDVEQPERGLGLDRRRLVFSQVVVIAPRLEFLVVEILDRLVIQQAVDRARVCPRIEFVRVTPDVHAPFGDRYREYKIDRDRGEGNCGEAPVELGEQDESDQTEFEDYRDDRKQHVREQRADTARAALDIARYAAGLALEVKAQAQAVQMPEYGQRDTPDRALRHAHEHHVAQFGEQRRRQAQRPVGDEQRERQHQHRLRRVQPVDYLFQYQRHADVGELGGDEKDERDDYPAFKLP